jgi:outer membrane autotransporter protein
MDTAFLAQGSAFVTSPASQNPDQPFAGLWSRLVGGQATTSSTGTVNGAQVFSLPVPGTTTCVSNVRQQYGGVQVGADVGRLNFGASGANIHFGVTGGYALSNSSDNSVPTSAEVQAIFVGGYATLTKGSFFADLMVRGNFYQIQQLESSFLEEHSGGFNANGISVSGSAGYNFAIANSSWFVEPSAGFVYSVVKSDQWIIPGNSPVGGFVSPGTVKFDDIKSTLGRLGVRFGTNVNFGNVDVQPFVTASLWHEFEGSSAANYNGISGGQSTVFQVSSTRLGTYTQYSAGASARLANTAWAGYARLDIREGSNLQGIGMNGGLRYSFTP